jgi:hypothetical protein
LLARTGEIGSDRSPAEFNDDDRLSYAGRYEQQLNLVALSFVSGNIQIMVFLKISMHGISMAELIRSAMAFLSQSRTTAALEQPTTFNTTRSKEPKSDECCITEI